MSKQAGYSTRAIALSAIGGTADTVVVYFAARAVVVATKSHAATIPSFVISQDQGNSFKIASITAGVAIVSPQFPILFISSSSSPALGSSSRSRSASSYSCTADQLHSHTLIARTAGN